MAANYRDSRRQHRIRHHVGNTSVSSVIADDASRRKAGVVETGAQGDDILGRILAFVPYSQDVNREVPRGFRARNPGDNVLDRRSYVRKGPRAARGLYPTGESPREAVQNNIGVPLLRLNHDAPLVAAVKGGRLLP